MVQFYIDVKEKVNGEWVPYQATDMQVNILFFILPNFFSVYNLKLNLQIELKYLPRYFPSSFA